LERATPPGSAAGGHDPVPTFGSYIDGAQVGAARHVYTVSTRSILDDVFTALTLKRRLEGGTADPWAAAESVVGRCALADEETMAAALRAARRAAPLWARTPLETRMQLGAGIRERLMRGHRDLVEVLVAEGTPRALAEWQLSGAFETFSEQSLGFCAAQMRQEFAHGPRRLVVRRIADGVVCVNPPQNAPAASALFGITALMAGNAVVVRAPRSAPLGVMFLLREFVVPVLEELGAPPGVLGFYCSRPGPAMRGWLESPLVDDIFYIGGVQKGLELQRDCVQHGKKPILELAGNDCVVVWRDADLGAAVEALTECFYGSGQICMVPNQVVAHPAIADELLERLRAAAALIRPGYPEDEGALLSPVLRAERFFAYVRDATRHGAKVECGAHRLEVDGSRSDTGLFVEPTVLRVDGLEDCRRIEAVREETFFPLLPVIVPRPADDRRLLDEAIGFVNSNPYGLRNSLWAADPAVIGRFLDSTANGGLLKVNDSHIGFLPYLPSHGGTGLTGGVFGEANYLMLRTSRLQGVSLGSGIRPREAVFAAYRTAIASAGPGAARPGYETTSL
jgi:acyl-CoA reductase-like NAD-dependent aldehyde dehydrogenase